MTDLCDPVTMTPTATSGAVAALEVDLAALLEICDGLAAADWEAQSGCEGWTVQDVVSHLGALFWAVVDPSRLPDTTGLPTEQAQEAAVVARRPMSPARVMEDYATVSEQALAILASLAEADFELPLGDLGTYPAHVLPTAYCFDHYVHIRCDLFPPRGPLGTRPPDTDERRLSPALDWIETALPQQNRHILEGLTDPVELVIVGAADRSIRLGPEGPFAATVYSTADACTRWITQRGTWDTLGVRTSGDPELLAGLRGLKIF